MRKAALFWGLFALLLLSIGLNLGFLIGQLRGVAGPGSAEAPSGPRPPVAREGATRRPPPAEGPRRIGERLGLSGEELEKFTAIQQEFLSRMMETRREQGRVRSRLRYELTSPEPDREEIRSLIEEAAGLTARMDRILADHVLASRDLLDGDAETLYLRHIARLGPRRAVPGSRRPGPRPR